MAGYKRGVPMGADLKPGQRFDRTFLVSALEGSRWAPISTVCRWSKDGLTPRVRLQEKVFDVVWGDADKRQRGAKMEKCLRLVTRLTLPRRVTPTALVIPNCKRCGTIPEFNPAIRKPSIICASLKSPPRAGCCSMQLRYGAKLLPGTELKSQESAHIRRRSGTIRRPDKRPGSKLCVLLRLCVINLSRRGAEDAESHSASISAKQRVWIGDAHQAAHGETSEALGFGLAPCRREGDERRRVGRSRHHKHRQ